MKVTPKLPFKDCLFSSESLFPFPDTGRSDNECILYFLLRDGENQLIIERIQRASKGFLAAAGGATPAQGLLGKRQLCGWACHSLPPSETPRTDNCAAATRRGLPAALAVWEGWATLQEPTSQSPRRGNGAQRAELGLEAHNSRGSGSDPSTAYCLAWGPHTIGLRDLICREPGL